MCKNLEKIDKIVYRTLDVLIISIVICIILTLGIQMGMEIIKSKVRNGEITVQTLVVESNVVCSVGSDFYMEEQ